MVFTQVTTYTPGTGLHTSHNIYPWNWSSHKSQHIIPRDSSSHKSQHIIPRDWDWSLHKSQHIPLGLVFTQVTTYHTQGLGLVFTQVTTYTPGTGLHTSHNIYPGTLLHTSHNISYPGTGTGLYTSHNIYPWDWYSHKSQHIPLGLVFTQVTTYTPGTGIHTSPST